MLKWLRLREHMSLAKRRGAEKLLGESAREIGVLMMVFVPLESAFDPGHLTRGEVFAYFALGLALVLAGVWFEIGGS